MNRLAIDTSNQMMGVAIMRDGNIIAELTTNIKKDHSSQLMPAIVQLMEQAGMAAEQLDEIIVAQGPGSYTGTRIGITTAKTMAWSLQIPIKPVSSLELLACNGALFHGYICPFFDARRQTVFTGLFRWDNHVLNTIRQETNILMEDWLEEIVSDDIPIAFLSPDIHLYESFLQIKYPQAIIPERFYHQAHPGHLFALAQKQEATSAHEVVPNYLRITEAEANWRKDQKGETKHG